MKIWIKNKEEKIEFIADKTINDAKSSVKSVVSDYMMKQLKEDVDYGTLEIGKLPQQWNTFECTQTTLAEVVNTNLNTIMHVAFTKKDGSERILTGYTTGDKDAFGRYYFHEITTDADDQLRLVDPRQLLWVLLFDKHKQERIDEAQKAGIDYVKWSNSSDPFASHIMFKLKR